VEHKVAHQVRKHLSAKAGGGKVRNEPETGLDSEGREQTPPEIAIERETQSRLEGLIGRWHNYMKEKGLLEVADLVLNDQGYREIATCLSIRESKARRMITTVNALTRAFGEEEQPDF
jgi:hypothetical protein